LLLLLPLGSCSFTTYLSGADENGGTVIFVTDWSQESAVEKAKDHCHQYNRVARVVETDLGSGTITFVCQGTNSPMIPASGV
jgi:hypothetical protein